MGPAPPNVVAEVLLPALPGTPVCEPVGEFVEEPNPDPDPEPNPELDDCGNIVEMPVEPAPEFTELPPWLLSDPLLAVELPSVPPDEDPSGLAMGMPFASVVVVAAAVYIDAPVVPRPAAIVSCCPKNPKGRT
jgi:hypothetical protein